MSFSNNAGLDFEAWVALAQTDAELFEEKRREAIAQLIASAPAHRQHRLRGLQWRIEIERAKYRHPLAACSHLFNMMWSSVYGDGGLVDALNGKVEPAAQSAKVLPLAAKPEQSGGAAAI